MSRGPEKKWYDRAKAEGRCVVCRNKPATNGLRCDPCVRRKHITESQWRARLKAEVYQAYGGPVCRCCGEVESKFLTIDHIDGGGTKERLAGMSGGSNLLGRLKREGFPPGFQILCFNCNWGKYTNGGRCPHEDNN